MSKKSYTEAKFVETVASSVSVRRVLITLGLKPHGGNYRTIKNYIQKLNLDTSHFLGQAVNRGKTFGPKRPIEDYLSNKYFIQSYRLKTRLIEEGYLERKCSNCNLDTWINQPIPTELHHIDGNYKNNNLNNLQMLCPNCHSLTDNFRGKNAKHIKTQTQTKTKTKTYKQKPKSVRLRTPKIINHCTDCLKECSKQAKRCKSCKAIKQHDGTRKRPSKERLLQDIGLLNNNKCAIGRKYSVSDNAVRKWICFYKIS